MASKTSRAEPITLDELGRQIARRRAELGVTDADIPRNSGRRRTASKKALLKAIEDAGGTW
jgi:hypothetical protein